MTVSIVKLLACQIEIPETDTPQQRDQHVLRTADAIEQRLRKDPADLVVLPELSSIDYSHDTFNRLAELSEELDGPSFTAWSELARRCQTTIVFGIVRHDHGRYCISQLAVGSDGNLIGYFDKIHIAQFGASMEKGFFQRGNRLFVFELNGVRIAPIICYDIRIPELTRTLCLRHEADLILHCGAYYRDRAFYSWHPFVVTRALENQVFVLSLNRAGKDYGCSLFCPPWVDEQSREQPFGIGEEFRRFEISLAEQRKAKRDFPFLADRLSDYEDLPLAEIQ